MNQGAHERSVRAECNKQQIRAQLLGRKQMDLVDYGVDPVDPVLSAQPLDAGRTPWFCCSANHLFYMVEDRVSVSCRLQFLTRV